MLWLKKEAAARLLRAFQLVAVCGRGGGSSRGGAARLSPVAGRAPTKSALHLLARSVGSSPTRAHKFLGQQQVYDLQFGFKNSSLLADLLHQPLSTTA